MRVPRISLGKLFNVLQSPIGRMASWPMRNIKTFSSKQMYLYLSLVERKEAEFYHNIDRRCYLVWFKWLIFIVFPVQFMVSFSTIPFPLGTHLSGNLSVIPFWVSFKCKIEFMFDNLKCDICVLILSLPEKLWCLESDKVFFYN